MADETPVLVFYIENTQPYNVIDITEVTIPFYVEITDLAHDSDLIEIEDLPIPAVACYIENSKVFNITMDSSGRDGKDGLPGKDGIGLPGKDGTSITFESLTPEQIALLLQPATDAAADLYETITQLQLEINNNVFNNWFFLDLEGNVGTNYNLYSTKGVSAYGLGVDGDGGGTGGVGALSELSDTSVASRVPGDILVYNGTHWENRPQSSIVTPSLDLGETSSTAYRGDRGKIAYDHSQVTGNPHNTTFAQLGSKPTTLSGFGITDAVTSTVFNNHKNNINAEKHLTQAQLTNLINLSNWWKVDASGNLYTEKNLYSTKGVSAFGLGEDGGSSGGGVDMLDSWANYTEAKADYYAPASLLIPFRNDTLSRLTSLESGSATSITTTGSGNAVTSVSKNGNTLTFAKGSTFSLSTHNHDTLYKPIGYVPSWSEITDKPSTFTPSAHTHSASDITSGTLTIARIPTGTSGTTVALGNHLHTGVYEPVFTKNTAFNKNFGTVAGTVMQGNDSRIHSHSNKPILDQITQSNIDVLEKLSVDNDGNIKVDTTLWATGGISAFGLGEGGGSGGGGVDMLDAWANYTTAKANYYVPASLLVPFRSDTLNRLTSLESGLTTSITTTGNGNAITSLTKSGNVITANKGLTFALSSHTHTFASLTNKPTTLAGYGITAGLTTNYLTKWNGTTIVNSSIFDNGTNVGIGTTNPTSKLEVDGIGKFKDDILMTFNEWSYNGWAHPTDKNSLNKFLKLFDIDTAGNLVVKTNLYSMGEVTAYKSGTGVSGLTLQADMNANEKSINNLLSVSNQGAMITMEDGTISFNIWGDNIFRIYDDSLYSNRTIEASSFYTNSIVQSREFKFGKWSFKQDGNGRLGIYNGTTEVACFNTDGTYVNL